MENLTILPGRNRQGQPEDFISIHLARGRLYTIVGNTGSGKSRLIKDVEQLAQGDSGSHQNKSHENGDGNHCPYCFLQPLEILCPVGL